MPRSIDQSRDLLFGLLALQTGLINQAQLVAAFQAWAQARDRSMAGVLAEQGAISPPCVPLLEGLVSEHLRRHGDDAERSLAAFGVSRPLRERLAQVGDAELDASLAHVGSRSTEGNGDLERTTTYSVGTATSDGQRFRVLRPHAQGGLGAVFVALDAELHREVALKQILDHHADDPISRQRFLLEAEITGGLEHPGVVPVYGLGSHGDGRPYYAMRFIQGDSLKQAIGCFHADERLRSDPGGRSLELRKLLRRFTDVCNAIAYAHSRGVLHRDIKPGNVIVGKYGETLVVDWGLAKAVGRDDPGAAPDERTLVPSSSSGLAETLPGSALGTPAYMSPEQAAGELDRLGPRSDVYSLGATLYCLLTGRPPFLGDDVGLILRQVQQGEFPTPRSIEPALDRALEAVCLKAMALKPEDRYASPRALADDVERWAADEPVTARPEPWAERARRWMRRRRTAMTAAAAALVVATVGLAAVLAVEARANDKLRDANHRIQAQFDLALEAIRTFHTGVSEDVLLTNDNLKPVRDRLLKSAAEFYKRLGEKLSDRADRESRRSLGQAYAEMANLAGQIGATEQAIAGHERALAVRRSLASGADADGKARFEVADSLNDLGKLLRDTGRADEARTFFEEARTLLDGLTLAHPSLTGFRRYLAIAHNNLGVLLSETGKPGEAQSLYEKALEIRQRLADANPAVTEFQHDLAMTHVNIAVMQRDTGNTAAALASHEAARAIQQKLADANPAVNEFQRGLALTHHSIAIILKETDNPTAALASLEAARGIRQKLVDANPAVTQFQLDLARSHGGIGDALYTTGKPVEALASHQAARAILQKLAGANPAVTQFQLDLARSHYNIGYLLRTTGRPVGALEQYRAARAIQQRLADAHPAFTQFQRVLAGTHNVIGSLMTETGKPEAALASFQAARAIQQKLADASPGVTDFRDDLATSHNNIGIVQREMGHSQEALRSLETARRIHQVLADANPKFTEYQRGLARVHSNIGLLLKEGNRPVEALASFKKARAIMKALADANPGGTEFQIELANNHLETGDALRLSGQTAEARESYQEALAVIERLIKAHPPLADSLQIYLVFGLKGLGATQQTDGQTAAAVASWRRAIASDERTPSSSNETLYYLAGCHARLGGIAGTAGSGLSAAEGAAELDRAMAVLGRAVAGGYRNAAWMKRDPDLDSLRGRPDFQALLADLTFPPDPFSNDTEADR